MEREHRFLLRSPVVDVAVSRTLRIMDRYVHNTRLRLRLVAEEGRPVVRKLGQKIRLDAPPQAIAHTTIYLDETEFSALLALPADALSKTRRILAGDAAVVDTFDGVLDGLVLLEIDLGPHGRLPNVAPVDPLADVTDDQRFTGAALARLSTHREVERLLSDHA